MDDEKKRSQTNLGEVLRLSGIISDDDIKRALEVQGKHDVPIGHALVKIGAATFDDVEGAAEFQARLRSEDPLVRKAAHDELLQKASKAYDDALAERPTPDDGEVTKPEPVAPPRSR